MELLSGIALGVILTLASQGGYKRYQEVKKAERERLRRHAFPKSESEARAIVDKAGPVPSDPHVGAFIGDKEGEKRLQKAKEKEIRDHNRGIKARMLTALKTATNNEGANQLLVYIARMGEDAFISERSAQPLLKWGRTRFRSNLEYLLDNKWIAVVEKSKNKGTRYKLTAKALKKAL